MIPAIVSVGISLAPPVAQVEAVKPVYLYPGQMVTSRTPVSVTTILGSCISVCLWDESTGIGGINHYLLPTNPVAGQSDLRYGNTAIARLIEDVLAAGAVKKLLVAKLVGGSSVLTGFSVTRQSIGDQNVAVAHEVLAKHGITVVAEQVGGPRGRKLHFNTGDGSAYSKEI